MTKHPCSGMTKAQRAAFEQVAMTAGGTICAGPKTIKALLNRGVIVRAGLNQVGRDRFGVIEIPQYSVPIPIHMQWCDWCCEQEPMP